MRAITLAAFSVSGLLFATSALAWHHQTTHVSLNLKAYDAFQGLYGGSAKYERAPLDATLLCTGPAVTTPGKEWIFESDERLSVLVWLSMGGYFADEPEWWASFRHFYDPLARDGQTYLTDDLPGVANPHVDARTLALVDQPDPWHDGSEHVQYNWSAALGYYREAMEDGDNDDGENRKLAKAFRGLGQVLHLLADMTQPAHVRNDEHAYDDPLEDTIRVDQVAASWASPLDPRALIDGDISTLFDNLARYTNEYYYSSDTVSDTASGVFPDNGKTPCLKPQFSDLKYDAATHAYSGRFNDTDVPMIQQRLTTYLIQRGNFRKVEQWGAWHMPAAYAAWLANVLVPVAVRAEALLIDRFLPTLDAQLKLTAKDASTAHVEGALIHDIAKDPEWKAPIKFNGKGTLRGRKDDTPILEVFFQDGTMTPADFPSEPGEVVYLEIRAGGRIFTSKDQTFGEVELGPECKILEACCPGLPTPAVIQQCEDIVATANETNCAVGQASLLRLCRE